MSTYEVIIYHCDGNETIINMKEEPSLEFLQEKIGGFIELVDHYESKSQQDVEVYATEEGLLLNLPLNLAWAKSTRGKYVPLVGTVVSVTEFRPRRSVK